MAREFRGTGFGDNLVTAADAVEGINTATTTYAFFIRQDDTPIGLEVIIQSSNTVSPNGTIYKGCRTDIPGTSGFRLDFSHRWSTSAGIWRTGDLVNGQWYHFVVTYDGSSVSNDPLFYLDNAPYTPVQIANPAGTRSSGYDTHNIGVSEGGASNYFDGRIAFLCVDGNEIWNTETINMHYWYGIPGGGIESIYPFALDDLSDKGTAQADLTNTGTTHTVSIMNALKGFVVLRSN